MRQLHQCIFEISKFDKLFIKKKQKKNVHCSSKRCSFKNDFPLVLNYNFVILRLSCCTYIFPYHVIVLIFLWEVFILTFILNSSGTQERTCFWSIWEFEAVFEIFVSISQYHRDHSFSQFAKCSEKLTFLTPWQASVRNLWTC